ncbi:aromatic amino acid ammonia-lyase [Rickettsiales bacterium]|nr:aromatic amino acid ammonia-lyase [Rickettsiales bacterium]
MSSTESSQSFVQREKARRESSNIINFVRKSSFLLDGDSMTIEDAVALGEPDSQIKLSKTAMGKVASGRQVVDDIVKEGKPVYGVNTGFGVFYENVVPDDQLNTLQENLIISHAAGLGDPLPFEISRTMVALRINTLLRGNSGICPETIERIVAAFNMGITPEIPSLGSVGASGDLIPLAHMAAAYLLGKGKLWNPQAKQYEDAKEVMEKHGFEGNHQLKAKEGLALINGTQYITAMGAHAVKKAKDLFKAAHVTAALSLVAIHGHRDAFSKEAHEVKKHKEQQHVAKVITELTAPGIKEAGGAPQDPYSFRCIPQVFGPGERSLAEAEKIIEDEMNSSSDNPLVIAKDGKLISAGNFHGQYPAVALDYLSLGTALHMNMSQQRTNRLLDGGSDDLPTYLTDSPGVCSSLMMVETAASSLITKPTMESVESHEAGRQEDQNSRGPHAARQTFELLNNNLTNLLALELISATRAIQIRESGGDDLTIPKLLKSILKRAKEAFGDLPEKGKDEYVKEKLIDPALKIVKEEKVLQDAYDKANKNYKSTDKVMSRI